MILAVQDDQESGNWSGDVDGSTWNTRGWTLQERALSTRSVHFCKNKMYFECRGCRRSEENEPFPEYRPFSMWPRNESWMQDSPLTKDEASKLRRNKLYNQWISTVTNYTQRNLTKLSDRLPAIQSTAAEMASSTRDTYLSFAGMWKNNLQRDLLWQVKDGPTARPHSYIAPTWSWASVNAKVHWSQTVVHRNEDLDSLSKASFEVVDAEEHEFTANKCKLFCRGFLQSLAFIAEVNEDERWTYFSRAILPYDLYIHAPSPLANLSLDQNLFLDDLRSFSTLTERDFAVDHGRFIKFAEGRLDLDNKDLLTFSSDPFFYLHVDSSRSPSGLILQDGAGGFKRVGVASVRLG